MAALSPDEKCGICLDNIIFLRLTNGAGSIPGQVTPSTADGVPLGGAKYANPPVLV